ncbi:hypothetical protein HEP73_04037 [Xanthomonas sp. GW]|nr:hypothetical protein HEP73_04037 [Xanthomonas sp. GW]
MDRRWGAIAAALAAATVARGWRANCTVAARASIVATEVAPTRDAMPATSPVGGALVPTASGVGKTATSFVAAEAAPTGACGLFAGRTVGGTSVPTRSGRSTSIASLVATEVAPTKVLWLSCKVPCRSGFSRDRQAKPPGFLTSFVAAEAAPTGTCGLFAGRTVGGTSVPTWSGRSTSIASLVATEVAPTRVLWLSCRVPCRSGFSRDRQAKPPGFLTALVAAEAAPTGACWWPATCTVGGASAPNASGAGPSTAAAAGDAEKQPSSVPRSACSSITPPMPAAARRAAAAGSRAAP